MESPESSQEKTKKSFLTRPEVEDFLERHEISQEDIELLEELSDFSTNIIIAELHNLFNLSKEGSAATLEARITQLERLLSEKSSDAFDVDTLQRSKELCEIMLSFFNTYGWEKCYSLVRLLEEPTSK